MDKHIKKILELLVELNLSNYRVACKMFSIDDTIQETKKFYQKHDEVKKLLEDI